MKDVYNYLFNLPLVDFEVHRAISSSTSDSVMALKHAPLLCVYWCLLLYG